MYEFKCDWLNFSNSGKVGVLRGVEMKQNECIILKPGCSGSFIAPFFDSSVQAGFPSPAADDEEKPLDLNSYVVEHPTATFFVKVAGDSMIGANIRRGDILVVDRSLEAQNGKIVLAVVDGEFTVKRFFKRGEMIVLEAENRDYPNIEIQPGRDFQVWGVVTFVIHKTV